MNRSLVKGLHALKETFSAGDLIRHIYRNSVAVGVINHSGYIVWDGQTYSSISTFAMEHKQRIAGRPKATNGWAECSWKSPNDTQWYYTSNKRPV